jgi:hypothetical protein
MVPTSRLITNFPLQATATAPPASRLLPNSLHDRSTCECTKRTPQEKFAEFFPDSTTCRSCFLSIPPPASARIPAREIAPCQPSTCGSSFLRSSADLRVYGCPSIAPPADARRSGCRATLSSGQPRPATLVTSTGIFRDNSRIRFNWFPVDVSASPRYPRNTEFGTHLQPAVSLKGAEYRQVCLARSSASFQFSCLLAALCAPSAPAQLPQGARLGRATYR